MNDKLEGDARFAWRAGNRVDLLVDADAFYPAMLQSIEQATTRIWLEMYLVESGAVLDRFVAAFVAAAQRGVRVCLLLDDFGCRGMLAADRERLAAEGVSLIFYNPLHYGKWRRNLFRDHRKILLVDHRYAFVGGAGLTDDFAPPDRPAMGWRETMVRIEGPCVADWSALFAKTWRIWGWQHTALTPCAEAAPVHADGYGARVAYTSGLGSQEISRTLVQRIRGAEQRVWLATAYFVPSIRIRRTLRAAARRGVDVRLLLPGPHTDHPAVRHAGRRFYHRMLRSGVRVFEFQPRFIHMKVVTCDDWVSVGSSNVDRWNLRWNLEANQEVEDGRFAAIAQRMFEHDFSVSEEVSIESWRARSWSSRFRERFWGIVDGWLERLSR